MYSNDKQGFSILDIIVKMILFGLFIFILVWLFNKKVPNMAPFYSNVFRENIKYMQEAAESYFTDDKMPQEVGGEVKMTLSEMLEKKLLLPFVDKDGNSCDLNNSYVTITKQPDESWILKTNLECGSEKDYTIKVLGCHNYCKDNNCEKVCKIEKLTSYQYKKQVTTTKTKYSCKSGYSLNGKNCYKTVLVDTKSAESKIVDYTTYREDALVQVNKGKTTYSCPDGYTAEGSGSSLKCYKNIVETKYADKNVEYSCKAGLITEGSGSSLKCYEKDYVSKNTTYSCPDGYTKEGSGSSLKCYKKDYVSKNTSYSCPAGYSEKGSGANLECYKTEKVCTKYTVSEPYECTCPGHWSGGQYVTSCGTCYKDVQKETCENKNSYADKNVSYSCPAGYTKEGSGSSLKCYKINYKEKTTTYSCPAGYTKEGSGSSLKCYKKDYKEKTTTYSCPSGYTSKGSGSSMVCYKNVTTPKYTDKLTHTAPDTYTYYCKDNTWTLSGKICTKTVKKTSIKYECPSDYKLEGTVCKKYKEEKVAAEATKTSSKSWKYTWSTKTSLDGWTRTGKTKTVDGKEICE